MFCGQMPVEVTLQAGLYKEHHVVPMVSMDGKPMLLVRQLEISPCLADYVSLAAGHTLTLGYIEGIKVSAKRADLEA